MANLSSDPCCLLGVLALGVAGLGWAGAFVYVSVRRALRTRDVRS